MAVMVEGTRVRSDEYGTGTIVGVSVDTVTIWWDSKLPGTDRHYLDHFRTWVEQLDTV